MQAVDIAHFHTVRLGDWFFIFNSLSTHAAFSMLFIFFTYFAVFKKFAIVSLEESAYAGQLRLPLRQISPAVLSYSYECLKHISFRSLFLSLKTLVASITCKIIPNTFSCASPYQHYALMEILFLDAYLLFCLWQRLCLMPCNTTERWWYDTSFLFVFW